MEIPAGELGNFFASLGLEHIIDRTLDISLHIADPGDNGSNEVGLMGYDKLHVIAAQFTVSDA